jgi:hypothetical protein
LHAFWDRVRSAARIAGARSEVYPMSPVKTDVYSLDARRPSTETLLNRENRHRYARDRRAPSKTLLSYEHRHPSEPTYRVETLLNHENKHHSTRTRGKLYTERHKSLIGYTTHEGHKLG